MKASLFRLLRALGIAAAALPLAGCWSSIELNNRAFVSTMIVEQTDTGVELTLGFPLPNRLIPGQTGGSGEQKNTQPSAFITRTGKSLEEALQKIQGDLPRQVAFGQTHSLIIGSRFAEQGIAPLLEFVVRNPFLRLNTNLFLVESPVRQKVAESPVFFERFFMSVLNGYVRNDQILSITVKDLMVLKESGGDGLIPILRFSRTNTALPADGPPSVGTGGAVILREGKLVKPTLTPEETSAARAILSQLKQYIFSLESPTDGKKIGFYSTSLKTKIRPLRTKDGFSIGVRSMSESGVIASDSEMDLHNQANMEELQRTIAKFSDQLLLKAIGKTQQAGADVFHFGAYISAIYPQEWDKIKADWRGYYKTKLKVNVQTDISLKRVGSSTHSFRSEFLDSSDR